VSDPEDTDTGRQTIWDVGRGKGRASDPRIDAIYDDVRDIKRDIRRLEALPERIAAVESMVHLWSDLRERIDKQNDRLAVIEAAMPGLTEGRRWLILAISGIVAAVGLAASHLIFK
jgi:hypothetical protein